ncbi:MAG: 50S ribosomal protein L35 [Clostridia bacterium]|nr:50S ribosomal protein L35 [Clostridia bacterium]MBQ2326660.1 50S ribosomal protein L35 [Clostridia bacterium]MBQ3062634.1 50S ribosomal protein L35 [Clostridia bacterium]MBQ5814018.1 50S ribosomal protein L35 [Clostridia bacterium]
MPKIKTHSGAKKRFSITKTGKIKRGTAKRRHDIKGCKSTQKMRHLRKDAFVDATVAPQIMRLIPYK